MDAKFVISVVNYLWAPIFSYFFHYGTEWKIEGITVTRGLNGCQICDLHGRLPMGTNFQLILFH